jgi:hypothetical protein
VPTSDDPLTGDTRCWPCTVANAVVGLVVGWSPAVVVAVGGGRTPAAALVWGLAVSAFTGYRLLRLGYLPLAGPVAKRVGLHDRIGPGSEGDGEGATDANADDGNAE